MTVGLSLILAALSSGYQGAEPVPGGATAMTATASLTSNAEHDLLVGDPTTAIAEMRQAWQTAGGQ